MKNTRIELRTKALELVNGGWSFLSAMKNTVKSVTDWTYDNTIKPAAQWTYKNVIKPAGEGIKDYVINPALECLDIQHELYENALGAATSDTAAAVEVR